MEDNNIKYGFLDQVPISLFKPSEYKNFVPVKKRFIVGFVMLICLLSFLMEYLIPFAAWDVSVGGLENLITKGIPSFELKDGVMNMDGPLDIKLSGTIHLKVDSSLDKYTEDDLGDDYVEEFLISKNNMIMRHSSMVYEVVFSKLNMTVTNQTLVDMLPYLKISGAITFLLLYLFQIVGYVITGLFFAILCKSLVRTNTGRTVTFGIAFAFALYARALFTLLMNLNDCVGGYVNSMVVLLVGVFFTMKYMTTAEKSYLGLENKKARKKD